jgi:hypothetical protein
MAVNSEPHQHVMQCVRINPINNSDLEFEFLCPDCGYSVNLPLFEGLATGRINVSHEETQEDNDLLLITLEKEGREIDLPDVFKNFLDSMMDTDQT